MSKCVSGAGGGLLLRVLVLLLSVQAVFSACAHVIYGGAKQQTVHDSEQPQAFSAYSKSQVRSAAQYETPACLGAQHNHSADKLAACLHSVLPPPIRAGAVMHVPVISPELAGRVLSEVAMPQLDEYNRNAIDIKRDHGRISLFNWKEIPALAEVSSALAHSFNLSEAVFQAGADMALVVYTGNLTEHDSCCVWHLDAPSNVGQRGLGAPRLLSAWISLNNVPLQEGGGTSFSFSSAAKVESHSDSHEPGHADETDTPDLHTVKGNNVTCTAVAGYGMIFSNYKCSGDGSNETWCEIDVDLMHKAEPTTTPSAEKYMLNVFFSADKIAVESSWLQEAEEAARLRGDKAAAASLRAKHEASKAAANVQRVSDSTEGPDPMKTGAFSVTNRVEYPT